MIRRTTPYVHIPQDPTRLQDMPDSIHQVYRDDRGTHPKHITPRSIVTPPMAPQIWLDLESDNVSMVS